MKIVIAAEDNNVKSLVNPHFGRCKWFCYYDSEYKKIDFVENKMRNHEDGVGCLVAGLLVEKAVEMVVAGRFGAKVMGAFNANGVQMVVVEHNWTIEHLLTKMFGF